MKEKTARWHLKPRVPAVLKPKQAKTAMDDTNRQADTLNEVLGFSNEQGYMTSMAVDIERSTASSCISTRHGRINSARIKDMPPTHDIKRKMYLSVLFPLLNLKS